MLVVVMYLCIQNVFKKGCGQGILWDNNFWLDLDYLEVVLVVQRCFVYFIVFFYIEIWVDI